MAVEELIEAAQEAVGNNRDDDYVIAPVKHTELLPAEASPLARVLRRTDIAVAARRYEAKDAEAIDAQKTFQSSANKANAAVLATACSGAMIVIAGPWIPDAWGKALLIGLGCAGIVAGALASMWLFKVQEGKLLEEWMTLRAAAESLRVKYFELVTNAEEAPGTSVQPSAAPLPLALLQAEYFRRYQVDVQRDYFRRRGKYHKQAANKMLGLSAIAIAGASLATGLSGFLGGAVNPRWVSITGIGVIASATSAFASTRETLNQHRRNHERYSRTLDALEELTSMLDRVRESAAAGEREPLRQFVSAVHEQLSLEHKQWLGAAESTNASIAKLEEALAAAKAKLEKPESSETPVPPAAAKSKTV